MSDVVAACSSPFPFSDPVHRVRAAAPDPKRFIGVHFFNPVPVMGLIEVIRGLATADETVKIVETYAAALGKRVVHANDAPGFIVNRVLMPMLNEADRKSTRLNSSH